MIPKDDIYKTKPFNPPYRFLVVRHVKWDKKQHDLLHVVDDPVSAYLVFDEVKKDANEFRSALFDYAVWDSFLIDATEYCKKKAQEVVMLPEPITPKL